MGSTLILSHYEDIIMLHLEESGFNTGQANGIFFSPLLYHTRWPPGLYITSWTHLKALRYCLPRSCHLLLVEWMSSLLTPV